MPYSAIVFDLDGTLLDTLEDIADACNAALVRCGMPSHPVGNYKHYVGDGVRTLLERAMPRDRQTPEMIGQMTLTYRQEYGRRWNQKSRPYAGIPEMLDELERRGIALAVLSNKPDEFTQLCVRELLPRWRFSAVLGAGERFARKPDPAAAVHLAGQLALKPAEVLYLGDTATDMHTATAAGMLPVGALWGFRGADELRSAGAQHLVRHPSEVLPLLDR